MNLKWGTYMKKTAIILSGGLGIRLKPFTNIMPKPLLPVGEKAILEIQIETLKKFGFERIIMATNYKSEYIENFFGDGSRYGIELIISKEQEPLGTAGPLKLLEDIIDSPFLVMNGDILTDMDFAKFYEYGNSKDALLSVALKKIVLPFAFGNISFKGDYVTEIEEKPDIVTYALAGIYYMKPEILSLIPKEKYDMDKLMLKMLGLQMPIAKKEIEGYWLDVGRQDDYEKAQEIYG
ncbi:MAG: NTP transferase domain-containing protein [Lachnospira sp.]|nr:NTP transferase domain-containing protein [Lachnospira sp.]